MEVNFELIAGVSLGFEIVTDKEVIEDFETAVIILDFFIFRAVISI